MNTRRMTDEEIRASGIDALTKAMGPNGAARFLRQVRRGRGDYTANRARLLGSPSVDEVYSQLQGMRAHRRRVRRRVWQSS